jgi:hypothetical protein
MASCLSPYGGWGAFEATNLNGACSELSMSTFEQSGIAQS